MNNIKILALQNSKAKVSFGSIISWMLLIGISCLSFIIESCQIKGEYISNVYSAAIMWSLNGFKNSNYIYSMYLLCGIPLLSVISFSDEIFYIKNNHVSQLIFTRINRKKYYYCTALITFYRSTLMSFTSLLLNQLLWLICCPAGTDVPITSKVNVDFEGAHLLIFSDLFFNHPYVYNVTYMLLISVLAGAMSLFSLSLCFVLKKTFYILIVPFIVYLSENFISAAIGYYRYSIVETISPFPSVKYLSINTYVIFVISMTIISITLFAYGIFWEKDEFK